MSLALVFPGQGAQSIGMGLELAKAYPEARAVFDEVDDALGEDLSRLIWSGSAEELTLTENAQPALMATSLAALRALEVEGFRVGKASLVAGHSLGEYSALAAVGALSLSDAARLLRLRGKAMQQAVPVGEGAMAALLGLDYDTASKLASDAATEVGGGSVCQAANDNDPSQVVISGHVEAVKRAIELASEAGAKRAVMLPVSAPFHCALMEPAAEAMLQALGDIEIAPPAVPVVANVTAQEVTDPAEIRRLLTEQVTAAVKWRGTIAYMASQGVDEIWEIGAGKALSGMIRRIDRSIVTKAVATPESVTDTVRQPS